MRELNNQIVDPNTIEVGQSICTPCNETESDNQDNNQTISTPCTDAIQSPTPLSENQDFNETVSTPCNETSPTPSPSSEVVPENETQGYPAPTPCSETPGSPTNSIDNNEQGGSYDPDSGSYGSISPQPTNDVVGDNQNNQPGSYGPGGSYGGSYPSPTSEVVPDNQTQGYQPSSPTSEVVSSNDKKKKCKPRRRYRRSV